MAGLVVSGKFRLVNRDRRPCEKEKEKALEESERELKRN